jgi:IS605 OrfB family transposase
MKKAGKYGETPGIPHYLYKDGYFVVQFIKRQLKRDGDRLRLSLGIRGKRSMGVRYIWVDIPTNILDRLINMVRIIPRFNGDYFEIEFVYDPEIKIPKLDLNHYLSLDLGLDNYATAVSTLETAFIIEGRGIKSYNQSWNKKKSKLQSTYDLQGIKWGKKMSRYNIDRYNTFRNYNAHSVNYIIRHCLDNKIGNIVVGDWKDMKRGLKMRKKTAQSFQQIPYAKFKDKLRSKAELYGISIYFVDEAYTSQTCCTCGIIRKANRVKRGLYRCKSCGIERNADINAAINIVKKVVPENVINHIQWDSGDIISPKRVRLVSFRL